ncbi:MAG: helix-turn-helix domain-containing protein [Anaerolineales bacterium]|nr:helix-turn-helix domain-containing protein [Anaerolineales bacterium]
MLSSILDSFYKGDVPNKFTVSMGELIRQARVEAKMSQANLAEKAYFRQAAISQVETGKREVSSSELVYLSYALNKPITYFFPKEIVRQIDSEKLTVLEQELLVQVRRLDTDDLRRLIAQARALSEMK